MANRILIKIQCFIILAIIVLINGGLVFAAKEDPNLKAVSAILVESKRGQVLFEKETKKKLHISSANKIMTALLALEKAKSKLDTMVTVSKKAVSTDGSVLSIEAGAKYTVEDLVYTVILTSANDTANALAEYVSGDIQSFVQLMNKKAHELKMVDTHFTNPTGLYDESQYTTAYDLSVLMRFALSNTDFERIFSSQARLWSNQDKVEVITNSNSLFWSYNGIDGGKTGYNERNRQTAITTATRNNMRLISIILDSPEEAVYEDSARLLDYGFVNFKTGVLVAKDEPLKRVPVGDKSIDLISPVDVYYTYPVGENYIKSFEIPNIQEEIDPPVLKNEIIGTMRYVLVDNTVIDVDLYSNTNVYSSVDFLSSMVKTMLEYRDITFLLLVLVVVEIILVFIKLLQLLRGVLANAISKSRN